MLAIIFDYILTLSAVLRGERSTTTCVGGGVGQCAGMRRQCHVECRVSSHQPETETDGLTLKYPISAVVEMSDSVCIV